MLMKYYNTKQFAEAADISTAMILKYSTTKSGDQHIKPPCHREGVVGYWSEKVVLDYIKQYESVDMKMFMDAINDGCTVTETSKRLGIPVSIVRSIMCRKNIKSQSREIKNSNKFADNKEEAKNKEKNKFNFLMKVMSARV